MNKLQLCLFFFYLHFKKNNFLIKIRNMLRKEKVFFLPRQRAESVQGRLCSFPGKSKDSSETDNSRINTC